MEAEKRSGVGNWSSWVGADKILVEKYGRESLSDFYIVDLKQNRQVEKVGGVVLNRYSPGGLAVVEGTKLFAIGRAHLIENDDAIDGIDLGPADDNNGDYDIKHDGASFFDLSTMSSWENLRPVMLNPFRPYPICIALGSKLFVFSFADADFFAEYYDSENKAAGWCPIFKPPFLPCERGAYIPDETNRRILCVYSTSLYAYYPNLQPARKQWSVLSDHGFSLWPFHSIPATSLALNGVLFFFFDRVFTAYDTKTHPNHALEVSWSTRTPFGPKDLFRHNFEHFLHLGDNILCLPTSYPVINPTTGDCKPELQFFRLQARRTSPLHVTITPLSIHLIPVDGFPHPVNFVPL